MKQAGLLATILLFLGGCYATKPVPLPNASRADSSAVRAGVVYVGMDADLARKALGAPLVVDSRGGHSQWIYEFRVLCGTDSCVRRAALYIENGKVTGFDDFPGYRTRPQP